MNILSLDTASHSTGYAIYKDGTIAESGAIKLRGNGNTDTERTQNRLEQLYVKVCNLISKHKITQLVAEDIFNDSNPQGIRGVSWYSHSEQRPVQITANQVYQAMCGKA